MTDTETPDQAAPALRVAPPVRFPDELPITARLPDIAAALAEHQVVIVAGETGSGKSTQLPKLCLSMGRGVRGMIGHTQPRRLAARTIAERIAEELGTDLGTTVGYTVRFTDRVSDATMVKVMTDGIVLAETRRDRNLRRYDTLIIDEAHERSLNIDFLLGYVKQLLPRRPDLKVIITSATIDTERFSQHFDGAPVIEVSGRSFPVDVRYRPFDGSDDRDQPAAVCDAVVELLAEGPGDVLVFLSGEREIHDAADALRRLDRPGLEVLPLYARLPAAEQHRIFQAHQGRRVVLSTNVAETSLTVPGVRYVVDAGTARISRYSRRLKVQRLPIEPISQASAAQRAGRCGRVGPGICVRLYAEDDAAGRPAFTEPEILRTNLASVILQMAAIGLGDVASFPFVDPPDHRSIADGIALLEELGAFDPDADHPNRRLTPLGRRLAQLPVDPRLGRMVLEADRHGCVREVMVIAAALSIQDPRERPATARDEADAAHARFNDPNSDFLAYVHLWDHLREQQRKLSGNQFRKLCRTEFLNYLRVREWQDIMSQLRQVAATLGIRVQGGPAEPDPDRIHLSLLPGLLSHIGLREGERRDYRGARGARFTLGPASALAKKPPTWVMVAELVETTRLWGRTAARVQPDAIEQAALHLVQRTYSEPRWDARRGAVLATERVTLYGLPIVTGRTVDYARIDPVVARQLFIRHALVDGDWPNHHRVLADNADLVESVRALEARARRPLLVDEDAIEAFYDQRLGPAVLSARSFDLWLKRTPGARDLIGFTVAALVDPAAGTVSLDDYPDELHTAGLALALTYRFAPGDPDDGITVDVPLVVLNQVSGDDVSWQVPGHRHEHVASLLRTLPKDLRRQVLPANEATAAFLAEVGPADGPLPEVLAAWTARRIGSPVRRHELESEHLPSHLRFRFRVVDTAHGNRVIAAGDDLDALAAARRGSIRAAIAEALPPIERTGLSRWDLGALPRSLVAAGPPPVIGYPSLVDEGEGAGVAVRVLTNAADQAAAMARGTRRLVLLGLGPTRKSVEALMTSADRRVLERSPFGTAAELHGACAAAAVDDLIAAHGGPAWSAEAFAGLEHAVAAELPALAARAATALAELGPLVVPLERALDRTPANAVTEQATVDMRRQLARLVRPGFVESTGAVRLPDLVRYVRAIERRLERLPEDPVKDRERMRVVLTVSALRADLLAERGPDDPEVREVGWMIEELRVSLFAQTLGTATPVSDTRIRREIERLRRG